MARRPAPTGADRIEQQIQEALALQARGRGAEGIELLRRLLQRHPKHPDLNLVTARMLMLTNQPQQAEFFLERAAAAAPDHPDVLLTRAQLHEALNRKPEAVATYDRLLAKQPAHADALAGKGQLLIDLERPDEAAECLRKAVAAAPTRADIITQLGLHTLENGRPDEACEILARAVAANPADPGAASALAYATNYNHLATARQLFEAHAAFGRVVERAIPPRTSFPNAPDPDRPLRVALLSRDLREHSVTYFAEPVVEHHPRDRMHLGCYSLTRAADEVSDRLKAHAAFWRDVGQLDFSQLCEQFAKDRIDIVIDLSGLGAGHRMLALAARPCPVAITYCGYPNTTGLTRVNARLIDEVTDPTPHADALATERLVRIEGCFLCYRPVPDAPEPVASTGNPRPVFASFNATKKYSPGTLDAWAEILKRVPESTLLIKHRRFRIPDVQRHFREAFAARGIDPARLDLRLGIDDLREHLALYTTVDIALDPFPYNGTTTTCETLWMGVPVVTYLGDRHPARVSASLLRTIGSGDLVAADVPGYIDLAVALATDPARLAAARSGLRQRMAASPLCDGPGFAPRFERAVRDVWRHWCADPR